MLDLRVQEQKDLSPELQAKIKAAQVSLVIIILIDLTLCSHTFLLLLVCIKSCVLANPKVFDPFQTPPLPVLVCINDHLDLPASLSL